MVILQESLDTFTVARFFNPTWLEYLKVLKEKEHEDWVTVLTMALGIYNGDSKGFAGVPES
jgi:hypothetical protein